MYTYQIPLPILNIGAQRGAQESYFGRVNGYKKKMAESPRGRTPSISGSPTVPMSRDAWSTLSQYSGTPSSTNVSTSSNTHKRRMLEAINQQISAKKRYIEEKERILNQRERLIEEKHQIEIDANRTRIEILSSEVDGEEREQFIDSQIDPDNQCPTTSRPDREFFIEPELSFITMDEYPRNDNTARWVNETTQNRIEPLINKIQTPIPSVGLNREPIIDKTSQYLISRLTSTKMLPKFSGDILEWLRFKQAYKLSTELGGYTEEENVARLYEALTGEAKETVEFLTITATNAQTIMDTLELRYGNKDKIIQKIVADVKKLPLLYSGKSDIITFAAKVRNCVAAIETLNHIGYLYNPDLIQDIINKMPSALIFKYNSYVQTNSSLKPNLLVLSEFLYEEAS